MRGEIKNKDTRDKMEGGERKTNLRLKNLKKKNREYTTRITWN